jgi:DNA modification methylase
MTYQILKGNSLDLLPTLADNSIDAIVTDPPYGLGNPDPDYIIKAIQLWASGDRAHIPEGKGFMGKSWDSFVPPPAIWDECLRVLKPGGHLLAFAGTRTYDLMGISIRMAGFEIRDSIGWVYGSGFPKSLDVSKAIDKRGGQGATLTKEIGEALKQARESRGISKSQADKIFCGGTTNWSWFEGRPDGQRPPSPETFAGIVAKWKELEPLAQLVGEAEREVIGLGAATCQQLLAKGFCDGHFNNGTLQVKHQLETAPSTPEAQQWQGWGTALKPALEPIVVARKPLGGQVAVRCIVENELKKLGHQEITWTKLASDAQKLSQTKTSGSTSLPKTAATFARIVSESEMQNTEQTTGSFTESQQKGSTSRTLAELENLQDSLSKDSKTKSLQPTEKSVNAVENQTEHSSHLTTSKAVDQSIESELTAKSGTNLDGKDSLMVIESFAGIATGLTGSQATVLINKLSDGTFEWPAKLPEIHKVGTTVAENVLTHGTGGLNIDASRIGYASEADGGDWDRFKGHQSGKTIRKNLQEGDQELFEERVDNGKQTGRWPANLILDEYTAELLDEQSGQSKSPKPYADKGNKQNSMFGSGGVNHDKEFGDTGGASRFFYVAKASKRDRNEGLEDLPAKNNSDWPQSLDGNDSRGAEPRQNFHPTVKPTELMRYLVKLITPPGGTVLDPFTGSGSTGKAAILEGFDFIGIELTEDYWPIIEGRLKHAEAKVAERIKETSDQEQEKLF